MKKIIFTTFLFSLLFLVRPSSISASCISKGPLGCVSTTYPITCNDNAVCCEVDTDCLNHEGYLTCKNGAGIDTAIGCIPVNDTNIFTGWILSWAVGVGGGIAFLLIIYASFMVMTSQGNPERLKAGQELLTSAISGLILLIFSIFILRFIGIDILKLNNWGFGL